MTSPSSSVPPAGDPYSRIDYRRIIAWPERIAREAGFLEAVAGRGPERSVVDLGCGTGEHARWFAARNWRVLGVDASPAQLAAAADTPRPDNLQFVAGDLADLAATVHARFGAAICLGNTLVHVADDAALATTCRGVHDLLLPGGVWLIQILDYERILARGERALPINFRRDEDGEIVFLRLLRPLGDGRVQFFPTTLRLRPDADPPLEIIASHAVTLRGWTRAELEPALHTAGFAHIQWYGDMQGARFDPGASSDLVVVAQRAATPK